MGLLLGKVKSSFWFYSFGRVFTRSFLPAIGCLSDLLISKPVQLFSSDFHFNVFWQISYKIIAWYCRFEISLITNNKVGNLDLLIY